MKKNIVLLILICVFRIGNAQNVNTSFATDINTKFSLLEKNRIPNHILLDYGFDLIDVTQFNGVLNNNNYLDLERYNQIYNTIVSSATIANITGIASPQQELTKWKNLQKQQNSNARLNNKASITLSGLLYNYSKINNNALSNHKISVVNDKYDDKYKNGVWQNPYDNKLTFAMVSPIFAINKSSVEVKLPSTLWHTNTNITAIDIDFGNNTGYKSLINATVATTNYTSTGVYTWTYRVRLSNGQYKYCRQKVKITALDNATQARNFLCGSPQIVPINATKAYQGVFGSATIQIAYGSDNCMLKKPLIVAEGLDTGLLAQGGSIGDTDIISFYREVDNSNSLALRNLITRDTTVDYDIVYVNWDNGTDFIQRNAYVLEAVINWVNANKVGTEQNVILGQSMGGLVARYALKDMENNTENHDTSLYISHDAPHQGAHIPLGILHMGRHVVNEFIATPLGGINIPVNGSGSFGLATIDDLLDTPAINQMLIMNVDGGGNRTNTTHSVWQSELQAMGYPQQTRNIALSNASHCGNNQGLSSNEALVTVTADGGTTILTSVLELLFVNLDPAIGTALNDVSTALLGFLPGNSNLDIEFRANAYPSTGTARIYKGRLTYEKTFLWLFPITRTIFEKSVYSQSNDKFIDNYPGGVTPNALALSGNGGDDNWFYNYDYNYNINLNFNFISVTSALDVGSGNTFLDAYDYFKPYTSANPPTGSKAIPFANFSTSSNQNNNLNATHISFNRRNGDWLADELDEDVGVDLFDCTAFCANTDLIGEDYLCTTGTYSVTSEATFTNWTVSDPNNLVSFTTNNNEIILTQNNDLNGPITITVFYGNSKCGSVTISKDVWVGKPIVTNEGINGGHDNASTNSTSQFSVAWATGNTHYYWSVTPNTTCNAGSEPTIQPTNQNTYNSTSRYASINWGACPGTFSVVCFAKNDCGMTYIGQKWVTVYDPYDGNDNDPCEPDPWSLRTFPNPVKGGGVIVVSKLPPGDPCNDNPFGSGRLAKKENNITSKNNVIIYDLYGNVVYKNTYKSNDFEINGLKLKRGHYILNVQSSGVKTLRKLITVE